MAWGAGGRGGGVMMQWSAKGSVGSGAYRWVRCHSVICWGEVQGWGLVIGLVGGGSNARRGTGRHQVRCRVGLVVFRTPNRKMRA